MQGTGVRSLVEEDSLVTRLAVGSRAFGVEVMEMKVADIAGIGPAAQGADQAVRHARHAAQMDMTAGRDVAHGLICGNIFNCFHWLLFLFLH
jgi:hypothetical protein